MLYILSDLSRPKFVIDLAPFFWLTVGSRGVFDLTLPLVPQLLIISVLSGFDSGGNLITQL